MGGQSKAIGQFCCHLFAGATRDSKPFVKVLHARLRNISYSRSGWKPPVRSRWEIKKQLCPIPGSVRLRRGVH